MRDETFNRVIYFFVIAAIVASLWALLPASTMAQCAMCKASLGGNSTFAKYLNIGVAVLLVPPVSIFCTIFVIAYRHRRAG